MKDSINYIINDLYYWDDNPMSLPPIIRSLNSLIVVAMNQNKAEEVIEKMTDALYELEEMYNERDNIEDFEQYINRTISYLNDAIELGNN